MTDAIKVTYSISFSLAPQCQRKICNSYIGFFVLVFFMVFFNYGVRSIQCMQEVTIGKKSRKKNIKKDFFFMADT